MNKTSGLDVDTEDLDFCAWAMNCTGLFLSLTFLIGFGCVGMRENPILSFLEEGWNVWGMNGWLFPVYLWDGVSKTNRFSLYLHSASKLDGRKHLSHHNLRVLILILFAMVFCISLRNQLCGTAKVAGTYRVKQWFFLPDMTELKTEQHHLLAEAQLNHFCIWVPVGISSSWSYISLIAEQLPFSHIW